MSSGIVQTIPKKEDSLPGSQDKDKEPWTYDTFGCFDDWRLCLFTFICPCYTLGRNAQALGEDGLVVGVLCCIGMYGFLPVMRWRIREEKNLMGTMIADVVLTMFCCCCSLIQENKQLYGLYGAHAGEKLPLKQEVSRQ